MVNNIGGIAIPITADASQLDEEMASAQRSLDRFRDSYKDAAKAAGASVSEYARAERSITRLMRQVDPAYDANLRFKRAEEQVAQAMKVGAIEKDKAYILLAKYNQELQEGAVVAKRAGGAFRNKGAIMQQVGYQVGDMATQISMGTNALMAFSVQGSQLLGILGPMGAVAGAALAIFGPLTAAFLNAKNKTKELADETRNNLIPAYKDLEATIASLQGRSDEYAVEQRQQSVDAIQQKVNEKQAAIDAAQAEVDARQAVVDKLKEQLDNYKGADDLRYPIEVRYQQALGRTETAQIAVTEAIREHKDAVDLLNLAKQEQILLQNQLSEKDYLSVLDDVVNRHDQHIDRLNIIKRLEYEALERQKQRREEAAREAKAQQAMIGGRGDGKIPNRITGEDATNPTAKLYGLRGEEFEAIKEMYEYYKEQEKEYVDYMTTSRQQLNNNLIGLMHNLAGENEALAKTMFVAQQAFAFVKAIMDAHAAANAAMVIDPTGVLSGRALAMGYVNAGIIAAQTIAGFKDGGFTGNGGVNDVVGVVHGQEFVQPAQAVNKYGVGMMESIRRGTFDPGQYGRALVVVQLSDDLQGRIASQEGITARIERTQTNMQRSQMKQGRMS